MKTTIYRRIVLTIITAYFAFSIGACSESTEPVVIPEMKITFSEVQFSEGDVLLSKVIARVENTGANSITYQPSCGIWNWFTVLDQKGNRLRVNDPSFGTVCPLPLPILAPGDFAEGEVVFGKAWDDSGAIYFPPPGSYAIEAIFYYYEAGPIDWLHLDGSIQLNWE